MSAIERLRISMRFYLENLAKPPLSFLLLVSLATWVIIFLGRGDMHASGHHHHACVNSVLLLPSVESAGQWFLMVIAMMSPLHASAIEHLWERSLRRRRIRAIALFAVAYIAVWMVAGVFLMFGAKLAKIYAPGISSLLVGLFIAFVWQASPLKQMCLNRCHWVTRLSAFGLAADRDALRFGLGKGFLCLGTCWALMFLPLVIGAAGMPLMLLVTVYLFVEHLQPNRPPKWEMPFPIRKLAI